MAVYPYPKGNLLIPTAHGELEALYRPNNLQAARVALVLHPHPQFGGTMHNKVVARAAKALQEAGVEPLRFNFRGVGYSTGAYDEGRGETEDARTALDYLLAQQPQAHEVLIAGFSFGSAVGLRLGCADTRVQRLIAIGAPARLHDLALLTSCAKPKLFIHGERDEIAPLAPLVELLEQVPASSPQQLVTIAGAGHFFDEQLPQLMQVIKDFVT
ncbi:MAG: alpha/beta fold hydrolase [Acidobacteria bacterium]|nr:alpha/beta fold hydrolase [Acidobacteriota bacterium]MBI3423974.1 alpha/beta fold hydrolase [Acidobacteriota bacterium]